MNLKASVKNLLYDYRCRFKGKYCNSKQKRNKDKCCCDCKKPLKQHICKKNCIWNPSTCVCECELTIIQKIL